MAEMTLPPVEVTNWTDWYKLWALANRYGLLAGKNWSQPTDAETYKALVQIINDALNGTTGGNLLPAVGQGSTLLPAVAEGGQQALIAVTPTDPATVGTISAQPVEGIVTGGGAIGSVIATIPQGSYGAVKKTVAVLSVASILGASIAGFQMAADKIEDLVFSVEPYTDDNGNIMTYTDENGKTYLPHDVIEAIRQKMIEMGAFEGDEYTCNTRPAGVNTNVAMPIVKAPFPAYQTDIHGTSINGYLLDKTYIVYPDGTRRYVALVPYDSSDRFENAFYTSFTIGTGKSVKIVFASTNNVRYREVSIDYNPTTGEWRESGSGGYVYPLTTSYDGNTVYYFHASVDSYYDDDVPVTLGTATQPSLDYADGIAQTLLFGNYTGGGVEGITTQQGATIPSDPNQTLEDYFPTWTSQGKVFNTIKKGVDGVIEDIGETTFLPATLKDTQPIVEGTTMDQTEAQDGTGQDDPDITDDILPAIKELIEKIINSPDIPTPTIPAGDSGDTPPAEPPVISGSANGLWAIYNPTLAQVQNFGAYLWSENILDQITRMFNSPIDAVIGFHMIYCTPIKGPAQNIKCGYLDTGVSSITVANQYATIDCGTIDVPEYYGTVLDYTATRLALYLPFIGIVPLSTAVCMGSRLQVIYRIDVLTGTCLAQVKVIKQNSNAVMYAFEGNCSVQVPLTATTYTGTVSALINSVSAGLSVFMGDYISAGQDMSEAVSGVMSKAGVKQSGSLGANAGALGIRIPYLIITHPAAYDAMRYNTQYGFPLNQTVILGSLSGYTRVKDIHLAGIPCTDDELEQIERLLKDGVIIN